MTLSVLLRRLVAAVALLVSTAAATQTSPVYVLGVGQDASFPQAGCYEPRCLPAWEDMSLRQEPTAIAVIDRASDSSYLFEATPEFRDQLYRLQREAPFPLTGIFLTRTHRPLYRPDASGQEAMGTQGVRFMQCQECLNISPAMVRGASFVSLGNIDLRRLEHDTPIRLNELSVTLSRPSSRRIFRNCGLSH